MAFDPEEMGVRSAYLGIDNGTTGWIAYLKQDHTFNSVAIPTKKGTDHTAIEKTLTRVDFSKLLKWLDTIKAMSPDVFAVIEKPFKNNLNFNTTIAACRCFEAVLIAIEQAGIAYHVVPATKWQDAFMPRKVKGPARKTAAIQKAKELWPEFEGKEADPLLMAEWARRREL